MTTHPSHFVRFALALFISVASLFAASNASAAESPMPQPVKPVSAGPGFVLTLGSGASLLGGQITKQAPISAMQVTFDLRIGAYFTERFGILAGVQGGTGPLFAGCASKCTSGYSYQFPIVAQYSLTDRRRGLYFDGGLGFLPTYGGSTPKDTPSETKETVQVGSIADAKLGIGYRIATKNDSKTGMDIHLGADVGQFEKVDYRSNTAGVQGDIQPEMKALHYAFALSVGWHFTP